MARNMSARPIMRTPSLDQPIALDNMMIPDAVESALDVPPVNLGCVDAIPVIRRGAAVNYDAADHVSLSAKTVWPRRLVRYPSPAKYRAVMWQSLPRSTRRLG